jgi:uncharacterized protein (DUF305 family)
MARDTLVYSMFPERRLSALLMPFAVTALTVASLSCRSSDHYPPVLQPGAPGQPTRTITTRQATDLRAVQATPADVEFMQGMIGHHQQAIDMAELLPTRTNDEAMRKLGQRIEISQVDEIHMMQRWLTARRQSLPDEHAMHMHGATLMPGMLTPAEMEQLAAANGRAFDRLFLEGMIKHHGGALTMVTELFSHAGAGQEPEIFTFVSDVDADQRAEIARMSAMLEELQK